jgi:hypothetical protein
MKKALLLLLAFCLCSFETGTISKKGIVLIHYNAGFNSANNYVDVIKITNAKVYRASIDNNLELRQNEGIHTVPTLILYNNGKEIKRWEAGINLSLKHLDYHDIQKEVNQLKNK